MINYRHNDRNNSPVTSSICQKCKKKILKRPFEINKVVGANEQKSRRYGKGKVKKVEKAEKAET